MLQFDSRGYLVPNKNIATSIQEFKNEFVTNIPNQQRLGLYNNYIQYSTDLKNTCNGIELLQWIDGSYVTKKNIPKDIDVVTFIDHKVFSIYENKLTQYVYPASMINYNIDGYIVVVYPRDHPKIALYVGDWSYWMDRFDKTRRNRAGNLYPKGFLEINY